MAKDRFGFGTQDRGTWQDQMAGLNKKNRWADPRADKVAPLDPIRTIQKIEKEFGDNFGSDLSMWVVQHFKDTGEHIKVKDLTPEIVQALQSKYPNY